MSTTSIRLLIRRPSPSQMPILSTVKRVSQIMIVARITEASTCFQPVQQTSMVTTWNTLLIKILLTRMHLSVKKDILITPCTMTMFASLVSYEAHPPKLRIRNWRGKFLKNFQKWLYIAWNEGVLQLLISHVYLQFAYDGLNLNTYLGCNKIVSPQRRAASKRRRRTTAWPQNSRNFRVRVWLWSPRYV